jgi:hypothetical protein
MKQIQVDISGMFEDWRMDAGTCPNCKGELERNKKMIGYHLAALKASILTQ